MSKQPAKTNPGKALDVSFTKSQIDFLQLQGMNPAYIGGMGSGKSYIMGFKGVMEAHHSSDAIIGFYEPVNSLLKTVAMPNVERWLSEMGIAYTRNMQDHAIYTSKNGIGDFLFRSMDNPETLVGYEHYKCHLDELDTLTVESAEYIWTKVLGRNRQRPNGVPESEMIWNPRQNRFEHKNTMSAYSTPEGYKFMYQRWVVNANKDYERVHAKTTDNPYLTDSYIDNMISSMPPERVAAYVNGEFANFSAGTVYHSYDRDTHESDERILPFEPLFIGCDFNVTKQAATVYVKREGGHVWHAVECLSDMYDTPQMIEIINERYKDKGHAITVYPDASGAARKSANASSTDIDQLRAAGYTIKAHHKNPDVRDRIAAMNKALVDGRVRVNSKAAKAVADCLCQQAYDSNGKPDKKSGKDHQNDATTYPIAYEMSIRKPMWKLDFKFA
jgi:PBSX family phage terminase large subunit